MQTWKIEFLAKAADDLAELDGSDRKAALKTLTKLEKDPFAFGKPLGNRTGRNLTTYWSAEVDDRGIRIIYAPVDGVVRIVLIVTIDARADFKAHETAYRRIKKYFNELTGIRHAESSDAFEEFLQKLNSPRT